MYQKRIVMLLALVLLPSYSFASSDELLVSVGETSIQVEGETLGGKDSVFFLLVSWPDQPWIPKVETYEETVVVEEEGVATLPWPGDGTVPLRTLVIAVNPRDGSYGYGVPESFPLVEEELLPGSFVLNEETGLVEAIRIHGRRFEELILRPGVGVWRLSGRDGLPDDVDGASDHVLTASLAAAEASRWFGPPPAYLSAGDRVIAVDVRTMSVISGGL